MFRLLWRAPLPALLLLACLGALPFRDAHALELTRHPSIWLRTETSVTIAWQTDTPAPGKVVYGTTPDLGSETSASEIRTDQAVSLVCLVPETRYYYQIVSGAHTLSAHGDFFETAPASAEPFRFLAFGDLGRATSAQKQIASRVERLGADLAILTGDIIYERGEPDNYTRQYFDIYRPTIARIPFYPTLGNHDIMSSRAQPYLDAFHLPTEPSHERYYSFDYSNAHFVSLEVAVEDQAPDPVMLAWLDADLAASGKPWKFVFFHVAMYSSRGGHGDDPEIAAALDPILSARGVDLVFQGHNHFYSRTYPISGGDVEDRDQDPNYVDPAGPIYIVTGGGGRVLYSVGSAPAYVAKAKSAYHVTSVDVAADRITLRAIERDGTVFDAVTVTKSGSSSAELPPESGAFALQGLSVSPNPSTGAIFLRFSQSAPAAARVVLYDIAGRMIREIRSAGALARGSNAIAWDGLDRSGRAAPAGVYIARVEAGKVAVTTKLIRLRCR